MTSPTPTATASLVNLLDGPRAFPISMNVCYATQNHCSTLMCSGRSHESNHRYQVTPSYEPTTWLNSTVTRTMRRKHLLLESLG